MTWLQKLTAILGATLAGIILTATTGCTGEDPATGMTCEEYEANPEQDVYFIVDDSDFNEEIWQTAHQHPDTARWNNAQTQFVVKYNAKDVPRDEVEVLLAPNRPLGDPKTADEIREILETEDWRDPNPDDVFVNKEADRIFVEDSYFKE